MSPVGEVPLFRKILIGFVSIFLILSIFYSLCYRPIAVSKSMPGDPARPVTSFVQPSLVNKPASEAEMLDWIRRNYRYGQDDYRLADGTGLQLHYGTDTWLTGSEGQGFWTQAQERGLLNVRDCECQAILACSWGRALGLDCWVAVGYVDQWDYETLAYKGRSYHQWLMKKQNGVWWFCETTIYDNATGPAVWERWPLQSDTVRYTLWYRYNERMVVHTRLMETGDIEQLPELTLPQVSLLRMALQ